MENGKKLRELCESSPCRARASLLIVVQRGQQSVLCHNSSIIEKSWWENRSLWNFLWNSFPIGFELWDAERRPLRWWNTRSIISSSLNHGNHENLIFPHGLFGKTSRIISVTIFFGKIRVAYSEWHRYTSVICRPLENSLVSRIYMR